MSTFPLKIGWLARTLISDPVSVSIPLSQASDFGEGAQARCLGFWVTFLANVSLASRCFRQSKTLALSGISPKFKVTARATLCIVASLA